jgi:hypothetical protein
MSAHAEHTMAVVLEAAGLHRSRRQHQKSGLVQQGARPAGVPATPAFEGLFHHRAVLLVSPVVGTHHLADVGRCRVAVRHRPWIGEPHLVAAAPKLERAGDPEDARSDHHDAHAAGDSIDRACAAGVETLHPGALP